MSFILVDACPARRQAKAMNCGEEYQATGYVEGVEWDCPFIFALVRCRDVFGREWCGEAASVAPENWVKLDL